MGTVRGYRKGTWLPWVRRSTAGAAESASGVQVPRRQRADWECAELALRAHQSCLPVMPPFCHRRLRVRPRRVGSVCSALLRARGMSGDACQGHRVGGGRQQGLLRYAKWGPRARDVTEEYSRGTPSHGHGARVLLGAHGCRGCGVVPPERPSPLRVCSNLYNNALTGSVPSSLSALTKLAHLCCPPSCHRRLRVRPRRVGSVCSAPSARRAAVRGCMAGQGVYGLGQ
jgi:hypothetical protein